MCEHHVHPSHHGHCTPVAHTGCCCSPPAGRSAAPFQGPFPTREERIGQLKNYLEGLQAKAEAVKEHIDALESAP